MKVEQNVIKNTVGKRTKIDANVKNLFFAIAVLCASVIVFIVAFITIKGVSPFVNKYEDKGMYYSVDLVYFLTKSTWKIGFHKYSVGFLIINTYYVLFLTLILAVPTSVFTALFIAKIAPAKVGLILTFVVEILASIPSIIYGLFGRGVITQMVKGIATFLNIQTPGGLGTLTSAIVLAMMIIPTITLVSITAIRSVKKDIIHASLALGASTTQTNFKIVLKSALPGIFSGVILGVGRCLGEATAITMVAGNVNDGPTFNLFAPIRTLTTTMLQGLKETSGLSYDIRFSVGIVLIVIILSTNFLLQYINKRIEKSL